MRELSGRVAAVTGAGSGIGREVAYELARRGARLAVCDWDEAGLAATVEHAEALGASVHSTRVDVSDRAAVDAWAAAVVAEYGGVNVVVNNAGIAFVGTIEAMTVEDIDRVMAVDFWGVVHGTKAFLPHLIASGEGHVVNVSSVYGLMAAPSQGAYVSAKFAVRGFTETLREEMLVAGHPVGVTCVHPGGIKTAIARNARGVPGEDLAALAQRFDGSMARTTPAAAAAKIVSAVVANRPRVLIGADAHLISTVVRLTGAGYQRLVAAGARRMASKDTVAKQALAAAPEEDASALRRSGRPA